VDRLDSRDIGELVRDDQIRALYRQIIPVVGANLVNGVIVAILVWQRVPRPMVVTWVGLIVALSIARIITHRVFNGRAAEPGGLGRWGAVATGMSVVAGAQWGFAGWFFYVPGDVTNHVLLAFVAAGMSAGAAGALSSRLHVFYLFLLLCTVPLITRLAMTGDNLHVGMAGLGAMFIIAMVVIGRSQSRTMAEAFRLTHENEQLVGRLSMTQAELTDANENLERNVRDRTHELEETIRAREDAEARASRAQKLEAIGTLAGGVAHDMNNVLGAIMSFASVLREQVVGDEQRRDVEGILSATRRGRGLTRNLLGFARKGKYRKEAISLNDVVEEVHELLARTLPRDVRWRLILDPDLPRVEGYHEQLCHALMNICINSSDAMNGSGVLEINTSRVSLIATDVDGWDGVEPGEFAALSVVDSGAGMPPDILARVFEPFYTTKGREEGTGLGMSMVYGTVKSHGGLIHVDSSPGVGTRVQMHLPLAGGDVPERVQTSHPAPHRERRGTGTVLVIDDDDLVRRSAKRLLKMLGYRSLLAEGGSEGLELFTEHRESIDAVVLDLMMPGMDGEETFLRLREIDPKVRVLISSGFTDEDTSDRLIRAGAMGFLEKPFDFDAFAHEIAAATGE